MLVHADPVIESVTIDGEQIETTPNHPFWTQERGWVSAGTLQSGEHVRRMDGSYGQVQGKDIIQQKTWMYNLAVAEAHTFFVGQQHWLVHNTGCDRKYAPTTKHGQKPRSTPRGPASPMDLSDATAQEVLNQGIQSGKQVYGYYKGKVYTFQPDNVGGYHGYVTASAPDEVLKIWKAEGIITRAQYNRLIKIKVP